MPIDKRRPECSWNIRMDVSTIANGYIITAEAKPAADDPLGQKVYGRAQAGPWYIREIDEAPEMVAHMIEQIKDREKAEANA